MRANVLIALLAVVASPLSAAESASDLVKKIADKSYKVRAEAISQLEKLGPTAMPALSEGCRHPDPEVAEQCKKLLDRAQEAEQKEKLAVLLRNPKAPPAKGLAGAEQYFKVTGDNKSARELYEAVMRSHSEVMTARETDPTQAVELFYRRGEDLKDRVRKSPAKNKFEAMAVVDATEVALFFIFAADPRVNQGRRHGVFQNMLVLNPKLKTLLFEGDQATPMRKLFVHWLFNEPLDIYQQAGFEFAAELKIPEMLPEAEKVISAKDIPAKRKALAMLSLIQVGKKEHVKLLTPYLADKSRVYSAKVGVAIDVELRDVAMGIGIQLAGEKLDNYGLADRRFGDGRGVSKCLYYYGFPSDEARAESHAKWNEWLKKNPGLASEK